ncbi:MAG: hypothetical protein AB7G11_06960 [Phycisphaerales bacterium]
MSRVERITCVLVVLSLALVVAAGLGRRTDPPPVARIATCDVYTIMRRLVDSDEYKPARQPIEERLRALAPELRDMEAMLRGLDPKDDAAQAKYKDFVARRREFDHAREELDSLMGKQFSRAYERVKVAADAVAVRRGYTHIVASRDIDDPPTSDPDRITQSLLSRPMLYSPLGDDVTKDVMQELKLEEK